MTLKMTTAQVVEMTVTVTNSSFLNYTHLDDHTRQTTDHDTPGFKPFTIQYLECLEGCANAQDYILVWGDTKGNHDRQLRNALSRIRSSGLKLNRSKCIFGSNQLTCLGQLLTSESVKADPRKVSVIVDMPAPENKSVLQRFLGMVTYLGKFVPNLSEVSAPLRELLKKDLAWSFDTPHQQAFQELKLLITNSPVLKYFDPKLPIKVSFDMSKSYFRTKTWRSLPQIQQFLLHCTFTEVPIFGDLHSRKGHGCRRHAEIDPSDMTRYVHV